MAKRNFKGLISNYRKNFQNLSKRRQILVGVILLVFISILYLFKGVFVAALVNGQPISRISVVRNLEKRAGAQVLDHLITQTLILQEAKKQNVSVSDVEINATISQIEENLKDQGGLDQVLMLEGMTREGLVDQIRIQKLAEKILQNDITISDDEVNQYRQINKDLFPQDATNEEIDKMAKDQVREQKLSQAMQIWLNDLKNQANINYFVDY